MVQVVFVAIIPQGFEALLSYVYLQSPPYVHVIPSPPQVPKYGCDKCPKKYYAKAALSKHVKSSHTSSGKEICDVCSKSVPIGNMKRHKMLHDGRHGVTCMHCGKTLSHKRNLARHLLVCKKKQAFQTIHELPTTCHNVQIQEAIQSSTHFFRILSHAVRPIYATFLSVCLS